MKICALVSLAALMANAQVAEIRGVLLEKATERPVKGSVMVSLTGAKDSGASLETNASGEFVARLGAGTYSINFEGDDRYRPAFMRVAVAAGERSKNVRVLLERLGRVAGRVIDDATGAAVKDAPVVMMQVRWIYGQIEADEQPVKTDADGHFEGSGDRVYPWVVGIKPRLVAPTSGAEHVITKFSEADVETVDEDYAETYWPGGVSVIGEALPAPYIADQTTDIGNIRVRKMKYRRALLHFPLQEGCFEGQKFRARLVKPRDESRDFTISCGRDQLLKGLIPGMEYRLELSPEDQVSPAAWRTGALEFVIGERNPELRVVLMRGVDLEGRVLFADGSSAPKAPLRLTIRQGDIWQERRVDKEGRFKFDNVPLGQQTFQVSSDDGHYAQHVKMNGFEAEGIDHKFEWTGQGALEVVADDQPGVVTGAVKDGEREAGRSDVWIVSWPVPAGKSIFDVRHFVNVDGGRYKATELPPGEYRLVAVDWDGHEKVHEPGVLERLMSRAEKVTLGRGSAVSVDLRLVDPNR